MTTLWVSPNQDEDVGMKHIANSERFQPASRELIPPLAGEPRELIDLDDELKEDPTVAHLRKIPMHRYVMRVFKKKKMIMM